MSLEYIKALYNRLITKKETGSINPTSWKTKNRGNLRRETTEKEWNADRLRRQITRVMARQVGPQERKPERIQVY